MILSLLPIALVSVYFLRKHFAQKREIRDVRGAFDRHSKGY
jgi:hypothetical protein